MQMLETRYQLIKDREINWLEIILIVGFSVFPNFITFPFHINVFLSWEGAYRLYSGQIPYKDFGLPMGFAFWVIPAIFFKIFGPYLITLIKAQTFINILSAFAFRSILKSLEVKPSIRLLSVFLFLISFSFVNFWPWYNHTVIVFELIGLALLLKYIKSQNKLRLGYLICGAFFIFLSFFTKQDAGAFAFLTGFAIIACHSIYEKKVWPILWFLGSYFLIATIIILPFIPYDIGYWFNYGQSPHSDRLSIYDIFDSFFGKSAWIKFYIFLIVLLLILKFRNFKETLQDKTFILSTLLVICILFEAVVLQVTSYVPDNVNIFFHSFVFAYLLSTTDLSKYINLKKWKNLIFMGTFILLWWSPQIWTYASFVIRRFAPQLGQVDESYVSIHTYVRKQPGFVWNQSETPKLSEWENPPWKPFRGVLFPKPTIDGMERILKLPLVKERGKHLRVLNMTELTPLAEVVGYKLETGSNIPLWYHKTVGMFDKQIDEYNEKIKDDYYDLVIFEYIPLLNNFYPFEIRDTLERHYDRIDSFPGPKKSIYSAIEVYVPKQ